MSSVLLVLASAYAQKAPDCISIAYNTPREISNYYHPHESDCNKYYQCAEYGMVLKSCPQDLHFDKNTYVCGYPHEINC